LSLVDIVLSRRSIRRYEKKEIPKDVLSRILEAGRQAPSAANRQPLHFIVVTDESIKREFSKGWAVVDTTIALQNMVIAAWAMGIGSCWIGDFKEGKVKQTLQIPDKWKVVALVSFGYPAEKPKPRKKKPLTKIVNFNKFN
jgi:nitroreductase